MSDDAPLSQEDIDKALSGLTAEAADGGASAPDSPPPEESPQASSASPSQDSNPDQAPKSAPLTAAASEAFEASPALAGAPAGSAAEDGPAVGGSPESFSLADFGSEGRSRRPMQAVELLKDVRLHVKIELGRCRMLVEDVLHLGEGSVVELDKLAGDPVDVYVNDSLIARGEVLVLNDNFCVRVNEIISDVAEELQEL